MADPFWDPIFTHLSQDADLLEKMALDTPDDQLLNLVTRNVSLQRKTAPFTKGAKISNKLQFVRIIIQEALTNEPLRKIIFYGWIAANSKTLSFTTIPIGDDSLSRLKSGEFGKHNKIVILSRIDPRETAKKIYELYFQTNLQNENKELSITDGLTKKDQKSEELIAKNAEVSLEKQLYEVREENRSLRKQVKELEHKNLVLDRKISEINSEISRLKSELERSEQENTRLQIRLKSLIEEMSKSVTQKEINELPTLPELNEEVQFLRNKISELMQLIQRKDAIITRLSEENRSYLKQINMQDEAKQRIERLQNALHEKEKRIKSLEEAKFARLIAKSFADPTEKCLGVFEILGEGRQVLKHKNLLDDEIVEGEFVRILKDEQGNISINSLEKEVREVLNGYLLDKDGRPYLVTETLQLPIFSTISNYEEGNPAQGIRLPELFDRPDGIYHIKLFKCPVADERDYEVSFDNIRKFLNLDKMEVAGFVDYLSKLSIPFSIKDKSIKFQTNAKKILSGIRLGLPVKIVCRKTECRKVVENYPFLRLPLSTELCQICLEESDFSKLSHIGAIFEGQNVLIVGGDYVGSNYKTALEKLGLKVDWISGFTGLAGLRTGISRYNLVVVIIRQISHTLLREVTAVASVSQVPLIYSEKRGISSVIELLRDYFRK